MNGARRGLRLRFSDQGPGIPDVALALKDGYTTGAGMGLGLGGSKRLMNEFEIDTNQAAARPLPPSDGSNGLPQSNHSH